MAKTSPSNAGDTRLISGQETKIPHASWPETPKRKNRNSIVTSSIKTLKIAHIQKNKNNAHSRDGKDNSLAVETQLTLP